MSDQSSDRAAVAIRNAAEGNGDFRRELITGRFAQVVLMSVQPGEDIGEEVHEDVDQILVFVGGRGTAVLDGQATPIRPDDLVYVRAGTRHNFINAGDEPLRLYTIYAPPEHAPGTVHRTKAEAEAAEGH
jgi:mannose-6-phosphate isomerase-like protein (cupin superfamily)